jgi:hypothetical protein
MVPEGSVALGGEPLPGQQVTKRKGNTWGGSEKDSRWKVNDEQVAVIKEIKAARTPIARITGMSRPPNYRGLSHFSGS